MDLLKFRALIWGTLIFSGYITVDNANSVAGTSVIVAEPILAPTMQEAVPITDR